MNPPQTTKVILKLVMVFVVQVMMALFFYRSRSIYHATWTHSDFIVFFLPLIIGFGAATCVLYFGFPNKRIIWIIGISAIGAMMASFVGVVLAFNLYGA